MDYKSFEPEKAQFLWAANFGLDKSDGVIDVKPTTFLQCPNRDGRGELSILFGGPCLTVSVCLQNLGIDFRWWISAASIIVIFDSSHMPDLKKELARQWQDERLMYALKCDRSSVYAAIRGYVRRRDSFLRKSQQGQLCEMKEG